MQTIGVSPKANRGTERPSRQRVAVIGAGISGLVAAYRLSSTAEVTLYEARPRLGGHAHTIELDWEGSRRRVETGFVVFNRETYPLFDRLLGELGVASQSSDMSFSVRCESDGLEYCGTNLNTVFAQRKNLLRPGFWWMLQEITRFNREATADLQRGSVHGSLGDYLEQRRFRGDVVRRYLLPMGAAIWSAPPSGMLDFPAGRFLGFLDNHRLLRVGNQLAWRTLVGGSRSYLRPFTRNLGERVRLNTPVRALVRAASGVTVCTDEGSDDFDQVIVATHADRALAMLEHPSDEEQQVLGAFRFQRNDVFVHTDETMVPRSRRARASWNYTIPASADGQGPEPAIATYDMSRLQKLGTRKSIYVSLNAGDRLEPAKVLSELHYSHPQFDAASIRAQERHGEISGVSGIHYCGAYWRNGFHEDGVFSAERVVQAVHARNTMAVGLG